MGGNCVKLGFMEDRPGQTFIGLKVSEGLVKSIENALEGKKDKSQFVREAIVEKLIAMGRPVDPKGIDPPSRKGKGGPQKYKKTKPQPRKKKT